MDLTQRKLTKEEWNSIEVPVAPDEKRISDLIVAGYANVNVTQNPTRTLLAYMKITYTEQIDVYLYVHYLQPILSALSKKYAFPIKIISANEQTMKKADLIRLQNTDKLVQLQTATVKKGTVQQHTMLQPDKLFEFVLLDYIGDLLRHYCGASKTGASKTWMNIYYTLTTLLTYHIEHVNKSLLETITAILSQLSTELNLTELIYNGQALIERNPALLKYADETLYDHQKQLFTLCKQPQPKLILYIAPTGTGKTMSPLGLVAHHRVIFVCAARHVGLALAKAAISAHKKVAFAFGCEDADDIRLHYFSAKEYEINKKSGGIGKVDNSVGDKVELMISDIQSYLPAMLYMLAFNPKEKIILYWDEPTITLDYKEHAFHAIIKENWTKNLIPNVVLSSATLPQRTELADTINDFCGKFANADVHEIVSYDCKKTIPLINKEGYVEMPHYLSADYAAVQQIVKHCLTYKTLLRYLDLGEAIEFIKYITTHPLSEQLVKNRRFTVALQFPTIDTITMYSLKVFYLNLLGNLQPAQWADIYQSMVKTRTPKQKSNIHIVTTDAHTLTDGPSIFLADDIEKIAKFYIQQANIPERVITDIMKAIEFNTVLNEQIRKETHDLEDGLKKDEGKERKAGDVNRMDPEMKKKLNHIQQLQGETKLVILAPQYIPNTAEHLYKYAQQTYAQQTYAQQTYAQQTLAHDDAANKPFTSNVSEEVVEKIMRIDDIDQYWKLLLMMGIGVFAKHTSDRYTELMKSLAQEQHLYLIIASSDYIYGTNYQFCHGYIGKDLGHMSQEKCIQAMGRIGRNKLQYDYSIRFRDNELIHKLFQQEENKPEVLNMNALFNGSM